MENSKSQNNNWMFLIKTVVQLLSWIYILAIGLFTGYVMHLMLFMIQAFHVDFDIFDYQRDFHLLYEILIHIFITGFVIVVQLPGWWAIYRYNLKVMKNISKNYVYFIWLKKMSYGYIFFSMIFISLRHFFMLDLEDIPNYVYYGDYPIDYLVDWIIIFIVCLSPGLMVLWVVHKNAGYKISWQWWGNHIAIIYIAISSLIMFTQFSANENNSSNFFLFIILQLPAWVFLWFSYRRRRLRQKA